MGSQVAFLTGTATIRTMNEGSQHLEQHVARPVVGSSRWWAGYFFSD
jgi:hypothetical protein